MKSKKNFLLILVLICFTFIIPLQVAATPVEMIILLDASRRVLPNYNDYLNYIVKEIISDYLRYGDTLHLISFDSNQSHIFSRQINNRDDLEYVLQHLFLVYPIGRHTDHVAAVKYLKNYASGISSNLNREIVIISDGSHNPPPGSSYPKVIDPATGVNLFEQEIEELRNSNWKVTIVGFPMQIQIQDQPQEPQDRIPFTRDSSYGTRIEVPAEDTRESITVNIPAPVEERNDPPARNDSSEKNVITSFLNWISNAINNIILITIVAIIFITIIIFILIMKYYSAFSVRKTYSVVRSDIDYKSIDKEGSEKDDGKRRPIIMKVDDQNELIVGTSRNIHLFRKGTVKSVGGGNSSFLIFLYRIPGIIASLRFDDSKKYVFTPLRPEFFPEIGNREIENPLDQSIKIRTEKQHVLHIKFMEYISPLEKINTLLRLTEYRGIVFPPPAR